MLVSPVKALTSPATKTSFYFVGSSLPLTYVAMETFLFPDALIHIPWNIGEAVIWS